jgi:serine/threonine protein kinase
MERVANHRNVVGYIGEMTQGRFLYLLTEFVPHGDLRGINFLMSEDELWEIIMQLALALNHLRKNNVVHRDIKP